MQAVGGACSLDDDMLDGDLGDGMEVGAAHRSRRMKSQSFSGPSETPPSTAGRLRSSWQADEDTWIPGLKSTETVQRARWKLQCSGSLADLSKDELRYRLQEATEVIDVLCCELEVAHQYFEGKYKALKILQGKAILDKATCHTKSVLQKSEEKAKALEKEVNSLQWEISFSQVQMKKGQQSWEHQYNRVLSENRTLTENLEQRESEIQQLRAENSALSRQCLELLSMLNIKEQRVYQETKPQYSLDRDSGILEMAVLGACRCVGVSEVCPCGRTAAASRKQLIQLQQELDAQCLRREEAVMVADAFRIAFEQQLKKRSEHFLMLAEANILKSNHCRAEGANRSPRLSVSQRLRGLLPSGLEVKMSDDLLETLYRLLDLLNDKDEALAHQRKVSIMLAHNAEELQRQLHLDSRRQSSEQPQSRIPSKRPGQTCSRSLSHHKGQKSKTQPSDPSESRILSIPGKEPLRNQIQAHASESKTQAKASSEFNIQAQENLTESQVQPEQPPCQPASRTKPSLSESELSHSPQTVHNHKEPDPVIQQMNPSEETQEPIRNQIQSHRSESKTKQVSTKSNNQIQSRLQPGPPLSLSESRTDNDLPQTKSKIQQPVSPESYSQPQSNHRNHKSEILDSDPSSTRVPSRKPPRPSGIQSPTVTPESQAQDTSDFKIPEQQQPQPELPESMVQPEPPPSPSESRTEPQELSDPPQTIIQPVPNHKRPESVIQMNTSESWIPSKQSQGPLKNQIQKTSDSPESKNHSQDPTKSIFRVQHPNTATTRPARVPASAKTTTKSVRVQD
ncbi:coiled-coil domain-containing protein 125 [Labrus mixtus]|uniref:coiled-coil domain-containing protein 125 n=1 Tax=Labrus mixtus TaxID=508554 RepID=UPI0029BFB6A1|nr:coiled-coil domain-containing protein 125 [Labrus mixtus]XP_060893481.1 coiled-coil domain-containing protein 125 [Labrus mixtus]